MSLALLLCPKTPNEWPISCRTSNLNCPGSHSLWFMSVIENRTFARVISPGLSQVLLGPGGVL